MIFYVTSSSFKFKLEINSFSEINKPEWIKQMAIWVEEKWGYIRNFPGLDYRIAALTKIQSSFYVVTYNQQLIGMFALSDYESFNEKLKAKELKYVYVEESFRGLGIGKTIVNTAKKLCVDQGIGTIVFDTMNPNLNHFYHKLGAQAVCDGALLKHPTTLMRLETHHKAKIPFECSWNSASDNDWHMIERNFIAAYFNAYKEANIENLALGKASLEAAHLWELASEKASHGDFELFNRHFFNPLAPLLSHLHAKSMLPLTKEKEALQDHFRGNNQSEVTQLKQYLIKLTALRLHFKEEFDAEKHRICSQDLLGKRRIHFLIARYLNQPVAFYSCELNYKTGRIYMRWVTISPSFQRMGLGHMMLNEVMKHFPQNTGVELYTRLVNQAARNFYEKNEFTPTFDFDFAEPDLTAPESKNKGYFTKFIKGWMAQDKTCCSPIDEAVSKVDHYIGYVAK